MVLGLAMAADTGDGKNGGVPYPEGYRKWTYLHTTFMTPAHGSFGKEGCAKPCTAGLMHFYANEKAMEGFRTGKFVDGSVIADEVLEIHQADGAASGKEGPRRGVGVMVKDSAKFAATGGWGYGSFERDTKVDRMTTEQRTACYTCHVSKKARDYVFTEYRER